MFPAVGVMLQIAAPLRNFLKGREAIAKSVTLTLTLYVIDSKGRIVDVGFAVCNSSVCQWVFQWK